MRVLSPADPGYVEWCRSGMPQRIRLLKLAAEKRRRIEQGVICPKCHRRRVRAGDTLCAQCRHLEDLPRCRECGRRTSRPVDGLCARCLKLVREQARPMCPKCGRCRCLEGEDMCGTGRQVPGASCVAILFSLRRAAAEGLAGRVVRPMPAAPFGEGEDMNLADVALEALYVLGVLMCCALLSREEGSREGLGSRRARLFMLALAVEAMQAGLGSLAFREPWGAPFAPWQAFDLAGAVLADLFLARALLRGGGNPGPDYR